MSNDQLEQAQRDFKAATEKRDRVNGELQRLQGKQESAQANLEAVEQECRDRGVEPEKLDAVIDKLQKRYIKAVGEVTRQVDDAEEKLKPYVGQGDQS